MPLFLFFCLICLGELAIFDFMRTTLLQKSSFWLLFVLPTSFIVGILFASEKKWVQKYLRNVIQLELLFAIGMFFYLYMLWTTKQHPLVNFSYFMIYSMALSLLFIFREFSTYLYLLSSSLLVGVSQVYTKNEEESLLKAFIYLGILVLSMMLHSDYVNRQYTRKSSTRSMSFPLVLSIICVVFSLSLMTWMTHATPSISNYLDSLSAIKNKIINNAYIKYNNAPKQRKTKAHDNNINRKSSKEKNNTSLKSQKNSFEKNNNSNEKKSSIEKSSSSAKSLAKSHLPESPPSRKQKTIADATQISLKNDLKFGDVDLDKTKPYKLFEVSIKVRNTIGKRNINIDDCYWKVGHLDTYDAENGYWYLNNTSSQKLPKVNKYGWVPIVANQPRFAHSIITQEYKLGKYSSRIFYLSQLGYIDIRNGNIDSGKNIISHAKRKNYKVISYLQKHPERIPYKSLKVSQRYLSTLNNVNVYKNLALKWTAQAKSTYQKVKMIERMLRKNYTYDLQPGIQEGNDVTYQFLFVTKRGYCQHFASAMVLLLRAINIPARVAVGCHGGIWDENKQAYIVSSIHRHAWVEVPFQVFGWMTFDPVAFADDKLSNTFEKKIKLLKEKEKINNKNTLAQDSPVKKITTAHSRIKESTRKYNQKNTEKKKNNPNKYTENIQKRKNNQNKTASLNKNTNKQKKFEKSSSKYASKNRQIEQINKRRNTKVTNRQKKNVRKNLQRNKKQYLHENEKHISGNRDKKKLLNKRKHEKFQDYENQQHNLPNKTKKRIKKTKLTKQNMAKNEPEKNIGVLQKKETKKNAVNGLITFAKNMTIFSVSLFLIILFSYILPQIIKAFVFLIKTLFSKKITQRAKKQNVAVWKKIISKVIGLPNETFSDREKIIDSYTKLSKKLETFNLSKKPYQTPTEYLRLLHQKLNDSNLKIEEMTQLFLKAKFSSFEVKKQDVTIFEEYCNQIVCDAKIAGNNILGN